jgi:hypothetical protein
MATDKETDKRLRKTYGIGLDEYNELFESQRGGCAVCGSPPKSRRLHVDHDHKWKYIKVHSKRLPSGKVWVSSANYCGEVIVALGATKSEASRKAKKDIQKLSIRGLLCPHCNRGLRVYRDNPEFLSKAADYLRRHQRTLDNAVSKNA